MLIISLLAVTTLLILTTYFSAEISPFYTSLVRVFLAACIITLVSRIIHHRTNR